MKAYELERRHGIVLADEDYSTVRSLHRALVLFRPLTDFIPMAREIRHPFSLMRAARQIRLTKPRGGQAG